MLAMRSPPPALRKTRASNMLRPRIQQLRRRLGVNTRKKYLRRRSKSDVTGHWRNIAKLVRPTNKLGTTRFSETNTCTKVSKWASAGIGDSFIPTQVFLE